MNAAKLDQLFATVSKALIDLAASAEQICSLVPSLTENTPMSAGPGRAIPKDRLAFRQSEAAKLIGVSDRTIRREIHCRKIKVTRRLRLITLKELQRYLDEEVRLAKRKTRVPRSEYRPVIDLPPDPPTSPSENQ